MITLFKSVAASDRDMHAKEVKLMELQESYETRLLQRKVSDTLQAYNADKALVCTLLRTDIPLLNVLEIACRQYRIAIGLGLHANCGDAGT